MSGSLNGKSARLAVGYAKEWLLISIRPTRNNFRTKV